MRKFKIGDIVKYNKFPYENDEFIIVGDINNPFERAVATAPYSIINIEKGNDFILRNKEEEKSEIFQVKSEEISFVN